MQLLARECDSLLLHSARIYGYDAVDNLAFAQIDVDGAEIEPTVVLAYDPKERLSTITRQTDTEDGPGGPDWITVVTTFSYDRDNRVLGIVHDRNVNSSYDATLNEYAYEWDDGNRLSQEISIDDELPKIYSYDDTNQLTSVELNSVALETFHYDANGNRDMTGWHAGAGNRLEYDPTYEYDYDDEGNLITKTEKAGAEHVWTYSWDNRNRLVEVVETDDEAHVVADSKYTYDAYDRRIAMEVDPDGAGIADPQKLWMAWDNGNLWADLVTDGETTTVSANYLYGTALDQLFAKVSENGEDPRAVDWYLTDLIGSVRDIADAADGEIVDHIKYSAFGEVLDESNEPNANITESNPHLGDRFKFASREIQELSGSYYLRERYYNPHVGHFISVDPLSFSGGDPNLARYTVNNPTSRSDPQGLSYWDFNLNCIIGAGVTGGLLIDYNGAHFYFGGGFGLSIGPTITYSPDGEVVDDTLNQQLAVNVGPFVGAHGNEPNSEGVGKRGSHFNEFGLTATIHPLLSATYTIYGVFSVPSFESGWADPAIS